MDRPSRGPPVDVAHARLRLQLTAAPAMPAPVTLHGHRGARGLFPENTLDGFAATLAIGVDALELDIGLTLDGRAVVTHDPALNPDITRDARAAWLPSRGALVRSLPYRALRSYDVGRIRPDTAYAAAFPEQVARDGARIPLLADVLRLDPDVAFTIEIKTFPPDPDWTAPPAAMADAAAAELDRAGAARRATLQSFDWRVLRHLRAACPDMSLAWLTRNSLGAQTRLWWDGPDPADFAGSVARAVAAEGGRIWSPEHVDLTAERVAEAHGFGLLVMPWTVNESERMGELVAFGVDGLITDRPDRARAVLQAAGRPLPPVRIVDPGVMASS